MDTQQNYQIQYEYHPVHHAYRLYYGMDKAHRDTEDGARASVIATASAAALLSLVGAAFLLRRKD